MKIEEMRSTHYCFTWNNYDKDHEAKLKKLFEGTNCNFLLGGKEKGEKEGTEHIQGYIQFKTQKKGNQFKKILEDFELEKIHFEPCKGSSIDNQKYCGKDNNCFAFGEAKYTEALNKKKNNKQGKRNDLEKWSKIILETCKIPDELKLTATYLRYYKAYEALLENARVKKCKDSLQKVFQDATLSKIQEVWYNYLINQDSRTILWIYDKFGNIGKTWFCKWMAWKHEAYVMLNGSTKNIMQAYNYQDHVCVNFVASEEEVINYTALENFKDGLIFKQKYESNMIIREGIKMIIFANHMPMIHNMKLDRWFIIESISKNEFVSIKYIDGKQVKSNPLIF